MKALSYNKELKHKVVYCSKGLANYYPEQNIVEINKALKKNKLLRDYIVKHELGHKKEFDLQHEFKINWKIIPSLFWFFITTPSCYIDLLPIQKKGKNIVYDLNLLILYALVILCIITLIIIF
jgi:hypothetical protein